MSSAMERRNTERRASKDHFRQPSISSRPQHSRRSSSASTQSTQTINSSYDLPYARRESKTRTLGHNAIANVIQAPMLKSNTKSFMTATASTTIKQPSSRDIPPVTLSDVTAADETGIRAYLNSVVDSYDDFRRLRDDVDIDQTANRADAQKQIGPAPTQKVWSERRPASRRSSVATITSPSSPHMHRRRSSGGVLRRTATGASPLSTIPTIYFEENFQLQNPRTFDAVIEHSEIISTPVTASQDDSLSQDDSSLAPSKFRKGLASNAILQEKLSWYMDTVELHLISSIATASTSFFAALGSLKDLQSEAYNSIEKIQHLRNDLATLDAEMAQSGLGVVAMKQKLNNLLKLAAAAEQMNGVLRLSAQSSDLADKGSFDEAIDTVEKAENLICGKSENKETEQGPPVIDLRSCMAFSETFESLERDRARIARGYEFRFVDILLGDLKNFVALHDSRDTTRRWASNLQRARGIHPALSPGLNTDMVVTEEFRQDLLNCLRGLYRLDRTKSAASTFRDQATRLVKSLIRRNLPSADDDDADSTTSASTRGGQGRRSQHEKSALLARNLRALEPEDSEKLFVGVYSTVGQILKRLNTHIKVLLDITSGGLPTTISRSELHRTNSGSDKGRNSFDSSTGDRPMDIFQALDLSTLIGHIVDTAQGQITKVLRVRSEQTSKMPVAFFSRYVTMARMFADDCESISGRSGTQMRGLVQAQMSDFVKSLAETERNQLVSCLETERWDASEIAQPARDALSRVMDGAKMDALIWIQEATAWNSIASITEQMNGTTEANGTKHEPSKTLTCGDRNFILVYSAVRVLLTVDKFEALIASVPSTTGEAATLLIEYLKLFNSRACQLILGAGATRSSAGLKAITTKHLALASQALSFVITLLPLIRDFVRRHAPNSGAVGEFDKVQQLYQDHEQGIHEKLVEILTGRASTHIGTMRNIDFDANSKVEVSPYMDTMTKETATLHRVLARHLPQSVIRMIMDSVFAHYRTKLEEAFTSTTVSTQAGKDRLIRDARFLDSRLSNIDGFNDLGKSIVGIAEAKELTEAPAAKEEE